MMKESEKLMNRYVHDDDLFIVHGALMLMAVKERIIWMKENNYCHRSLLPMNGLHYGKPYARHPIGNITKFMPLYNSLSRDILQSLRFHCVLIPFVLY